MYGHHHPSNYHLAYLVDRSQLQLSGCLGLEHQHVRPGLEVLWNPLEPGRLSGTAQPAAWRRELMLPWWLGDWGER